MQGETEPTTEREKIPVRRVITMLFPAFISLGLVVLILVWQEYNPPGWQRAIVSHLSAYDPAPREVLSAGIITVAQLPFLLGSDTPFQPVSPSVHYQTEPLPGDVRLESSESLGAGKQPLPYPVMEVYCIDLSRSSAQIPDSRYLVAHHEDLHNSDWIVYIPRGRASPQAVDGAWDQLGCDPEEE
jgi:hypothetical protein